jgi:hypothetical protein
MHRLSWYCHRQLCAMTEIRYLDNSVLFFSLLGENEKKKKCADPDFFFLWISHFSLIGLLLCSSFFLFFFIHFNYLNNINKQSKIETI